MDNDPTLEAFSTQEGQVKKISKYIIECKLGRGAMGVVYKAFDPVIQRIVALKTVEKGTLDNDEQEHVLSRFRREAQAAGRLQHKNIVTVYEYGEDTRYAFIAMELLEGRDLKHYFDNKQRFTINQIVDLMTQILDALDYSHKNGVIHRDIKPSNIVLLDKNYQIKVTDFGIARIESSSLTQTGTVIGTPSYMSPEQIQGNRVDRRSDLFSAGVIFYQFLTGERPFVGENLTAIALKIIKENPIAPSDLNQEVSRYFDTVIYKALAKNPNMRFQTAAEFIEAIEDALEGRGLSSFAEQTDSFGIDEFASVQKIVQQEREAKKELSNLPPPDLSLIELICDPPSIELKEVKKHLS